MKGEALWARPCIRGRTGILELEPKVSECADRVSRNANYSRVLRLAPADS
jgi:hypothetical protein